MATKIKKITNQKSKYDIRLNKPEDVRRLISRTINELKKDELSEGKAKTIGYLCNILLNAMESTELAKRIEELEERVK